MIIPFVVFQIVAKPLIPCMMIHLYVYIYKMSVIV